MKHVLKIRKPRPGDAVVRFGDWTRRGPQLMLDRRHWASIGSPDEVTASLDFGYQQEVEPPCGTD